MPTTHSSYNNLMPKPTLIARFYRARAKAHQRKRLLFPSPAEIKLIRLMGGRVLIFPFIRGNGNKFPLAIVLSMGPIFKAEHIQREVRIGKMWVDFGNDIGRAIEVDGRDYHMDIVREQQREDYLSGYCNKKCKRRCSKHLNQGWRVMHIRASDLWQHGDVVYWRVREFLAD